MEKKTTVMMKCREYFLFALLLTFFSSFLFAQNGGQKGEVQNGVAPNVVQSGKTDSVTFLEGKQYEKKLRFQKIWKNYLVFYDNEHQLFYLTFRKDRWDYSNDEKVKDLVDSVEYYVAFLYSGAAVDEEGLEKPEKPEPEKSAGTKNRIIRNTKYIFFGEYKKHQNFQIDSIRF